MESTEQAGPAGKPQRILASAERLKAFTDAVVAIAMTLLILPLMESVGEAARAGETAGTWVIDHWAQLFSFALSFVLIAMFWLSHHRMFDRIRRVNGPLLILTIAWMFTIVWLPVATAIVGQMPDDIVQKSLYIGSLFVTSMLMAATGWYILRHPELHEIPEGSIRRGILAELIASALFAVAYVLAAFVPAVGWNAMFLLLLTGPLHRWLRRYARG